MSWSYTFNYLLCSDWKLTNVYLQSKIWSHVRDMTKPILFHNKRAWRDSPIIFQLQYECQRNILDSLYF